MRKIIVGLVLAFASATVAQTPAPTLTFDPPIISFTAVVGQTYEQIVTVTNNTGANFVIESIETSGYPPWSYVKGDCYEQQVPGNVCTVTIGFTPTASGTIIGALNFYSDANLQGGTISASVPLVGVAKPAPRQRARWKSVHRFGQDESQ
jgi:hypothetical protein